MILRDPVLLIFLLLIPLVLYLYFFRRRRESVRYPSLDVLGRIRPSGNLRFRHAPIYIRSAVLFLLVVSLARPQEGLEEIDISSEGIDIMLAIDISGSMRAEDFIVGGKRHNRLYAVKAVVRDFILGRKDDQIGMVVFAKYAYTQCPPTLDYGVLLQFLDELKIVPPNSDEDGTAIGSAIATCVNRLRETPGKSKVVILLTDGQNNFGKIDPVAAAELAEAFGIKIYTIGAGARGKAPCPVYDPVMGKRYAWMMVDIDENVLREIAEITGGEYFRATDTQSLGRIYSEIDRMEKTPIKERHFMDYRDLFSYLTLAAAALLLLEIVLSNTVLRRIP